LDRAALFQNQAANCSSAEACQSYEGCDGYQAPRNQAYLGFLRQFALLASSYPEFYGKFHFNSLENLFLILQKKILPRDYFLIQ